jgi:hypothetical protein
MGSSWSKPSREAMPDRYVPFIKWSIYIPFLIMEKFGELAEPAMFWNVSQCWILDTCRTICQLILFHEKINLTIVEEQFRKELKFCRLELWAVEQTLRKILWSCRTGAGERSSSPGPPQAFLGFR